MERDVRVRAVVTNTRPYGEMHRSVTLLTDSLGLINAKIFGGRKGKKTALAPLYSYGTFQLYHNPVNDTYTLSEEESEFTPLGIMKDLQATYTAAYMCEASSRLVGDIPQSVCSLLCSALKILDNNPDQSRKVLIDFTWRLIQTSGISAGFDTCPSCDRKLDDNETMLFSTTLGTPVCKDCADDGKLVLLPGCRRYLAYTQNMSIEEAFEVKLFDTAQQRLRDFLIMWISFFSQQSLQTLKSGLI